MFTRIQALFDSAESLVLKTVASRKSMGALTAAVAAFHSHRPDLAVAAVLTFVLSEAYVDSKSV